MGNRGGKWWASVVSTGGAGERGKGAAVGGREHPELFEGGGRRHNLCNSPGGLRRIRRTSPG